MLSNHVEPRCLHTSNMKGMKQGTKAWHNWMQRQCILSPCPFTSTLFHHCTLMPFLHCAVPSCPFTTMPLCPFTFEPFMPFHPCAMPSRPFTTMPLHPFTFEPFMPSSPLPVQNFGHKAQTNYKGDSITSHQLC